MPNKVMYPPDLLAIVTDTFRKLDAMNSPIEFPEAKALGEMLEVAFLASLMTEESRRLEFRLAYCGLDRLGEVSRHGVQWLPFNVPRPCTAAEVRRLAPALDRAKSMICCHGQTELKIFGILTGHSDNSAMCDLSVLSGQELPAVFNVASTSPGELTANRGDACFVHLREGRLRFPTVLQIAGPILSPLREIEDQLRAEALQWLVSEGKSSNAHWFHTPYFPFLAHLLSTLERAGHGGTLLVVPQKRVAMMNDDIIRLKYRLESANGWNLCVNWVKRLLTDSNGRQHDRGGDIPSVSSNDREQEDSSSDAGSLYRSVMRFAEFVADLGRVDGAVVISDKLEVIGFGAEITAHTEQVTHVCIYPDARTASRIEPVDANGTRHRSVIRFCSAVPGSIGFILSQDGGLKAATLGASGVEMWGDVVPHITG